MLESDKIYDGFKELLRNLLCLNPYFRWSINECLQSPVFDNIRSDQLESSATHKIKLEVDSDDAFDYEEGKSSKFTRKDYILLLLSESEEMHAQRLQKYKKYIWTLDRECHQILCYNPIILIGEITSNYYNL